jgi:hypothetical protein
MRYRYLVIGLANEVVFGTANRKDAKVYTKDGDYIVVDAETGIVMKEGGRGTYSVLSLDEAFDLDSGDGDGDDDDDDDDDGLGDLDDPDDQTEVVLVPVEDDDDGLGDLDDPSGVTCEEY